MGYIYRKQINQFLSMWVTLFASNWKFFISHLEILNLNLICEIIYRFTSVTKFGVPMGNKFSSFWWEKKESGTKIFPTILEKEPRPYTLSSTYPPINFKVDIDRSTTYPWIQLGNKHLCVLCHRPKWKKQYNRIINPIQRKFHSSTNLKATLWYCYLSELF